MVTFGVEESLETCELRIQNCDTPAAAGRLGVLGCRRFSVRGGIRRLESAACRIIEFFIRNNQ
jgi:hypothetical protein